jgi:hypothetical protein
MSEPAVSAAPTALYVYGVVPAGTHLALPGAGVDASDVAIFEAGEVAAITGVVPLEEYGEEPLHRHLNDRDWLEQTAQAHEAVLEHALGTTTVIPFRMTTLYESEDSLRAFLEERSEVLSELLELFAGRVELGVKAYYVRPEAQTPAAESGRAYLLHRQAEQVVDRDANAFAIQCAEDSHYWLTRAAFAARVNRAQPSELSGRSEQMLLNGAYLVARDDTQFEVAVRTLEQRYSGQGVMYEITGPWPPYNFVPRDLAAA